VDTLLSRKITLAGIGVIILMALLMCVFSLYRIEEGEQALVLTFGEVTDINNEAGLYWHIPIAQTVQKQSLTEIYTLEYGFRTASAGTTSSGATYYPREEEAVMITRDSSIVNVEAIYLVSVNDAEKFLYNTRAPFETMQFAFETVLRRNIQNLNLDDALLNKLDIEAAVLPDFEELLAAYDIGVDVQEVRIQNIIVPDEVMSAYQDVTNAKNEKTQRNDEAEKYYNEVVPAARAEAYSMIQDAEAYKAETIATAQGDVALFNEVYQKYILSPDITRRRLLIETIEKIMNNAEHKYIVEDSEDGTLKFLPLEGGANE